MRSTAPRESRPSNEKLAKCARAKRANLTTVAHLHSTKTANAPERELALATWGRARRGACISPHAPLRWLFLACVFYACVAALAPASAAEAYSADAVKAEFLYRFAGYVEWPPEVSADAPFTIAVAGSDGVFAELLRLKAGRSIQNRPVEIRKVAVESDLVRVQILYIAPHAKSSARALLAAASGRPILIVSDEDGGLGAGSAVNFVQLDRHVRFEISLTAAEHSHLKINAGLLSVAAKVEGARPHADASCWPMSAFGITPACALRSALAAADTHAAGRRPLRDANLVHPS
jgi:YfiR/HmsC-like